MTEMLNRRAFLGRSALIGCSLAASPLVTPLSFAAVPGDNRLVVIVLRGGMDGLDVVQPYGDPAFAGLRGAPALGDPEGPVDLDGYFALHPALRPLLPLWKDGQLGFVHAVSTPYRDKRSHFDGQDLLEAGLTDLGQGRSGGGWLNRVVGLQSGATAETAYAIGRDGMAILDGAAPVARWAPESDLALSPQALRLAQLVMQDDPVFSATMEQALEIADSDGDAVAVEGGRRKMLSMVKSDMQSVGRGGAETRIAEFAAKRLRADTRIASFSISGWDTHRSQDRVLARGLSRLSEAILGLQKGLGGQVWKRTTVVAVTEFGRTARRNGSDGTDHGTGGLMLLAGGALRGGRVLGDWPGLDEASLYQRRDLMPTRDLRAHLGWLLHSLYGLPLSTISQTVFPGVDMGDDPKLIL
ncbi:DUF1501 domain-containing protein [Thalassococcus sp. BH17M4-6]|uniref:DUF1501 domain-containing protein n=1 Tax=Thalassococcus sp. BH17M4-6 TaxID=3413148 RepID=UPI003BE55B61